MSAVLVTGIGRVRPEPAAAPDLERPVPHALAHRVVLDAVGLLGRKTVRFNHRSTLLAMAACDLALADAGLRVDDGNRCDVGITVGTTGGSLTGQVDFGLDTFTQSRPYLVDATGFPNSVINNTAGALAIRTGIRGANATVAAGPLAGIAALRQAQVALRARHVDTVVAGAVEEYTEPAAWWYETAVHAGVPGEGAAMFVLDHPEAAARAGRRPRAELLAAFQRAGDPADPAFVARTIAGALAAAGTEPGRIAAVHLRRTGSDAVDRAQREGLAAVTPVVPHTDDDTLGDCYSAHAALQIAQLIDRLHALPAGDAPVGMVLAADPTGAFGVAVLRRPPAEDQR